jgi:hypothetical protein
MNIAKTVLIVISALMVRTAKAISQNEHAGGYAQKCNLQRLQMAR